MYKEIETLIKDIIYQVKQNDKRNNALIISKLLYLKVKFEDLEQENQELKVKNKQIRADKAEA